MWPIAWKGGDGFRLSRPSSAIDQRLSGALAFGVDAGQECEVMVATA
jgi:hypothetical protein